MRATEIGGIAPASLATVMKLQKSRIALHPATELPRACCILKLYVKKSS